VSALLALAGGPGHTRRPRVQATGGIDHSDRQRGRVCDSTWSIQGEHLNAGLLVPAWIAAEGTYLVLGESHHRSDACRRRHIRQFARWFVNEKRAARFWLFPNFFQPSDVAPPLSKGEKNVVRKQPIETMRVTNRSRRPSRSKSRSLAVQARRGHSIWSWRGGRQGRGLPRARKSMVTRWPSVASNYKRFTLTLVASGFARGSGPALFLLHGHPRTHMTVAHD